MAAGAATKKGYVRETVKLTKAHVTRAERLLLDGRSLAAAWSGATRRSAG